MRSLSIASSFVLLTTLLTGCPGDGKDHSGGGDDSTPATGDCTLDADGDGYDECDDCNDSNAAINPGATEECDGVDNDCDDEIDEDVTNTYYQDADGDGFGDEAVWSEACEPTDGWVPVDGDCDDADPYVYPDAEEICDGIDNDCDGTRDDGLDTTTYYHDGDADGYGDPNESIDACEMPDGYTDNDMDCDDLNALEPVHADPVAGSASGTGSVTNPLDTLQACIDQAESCCYALPGTYEEDVNTNGQNILILGLEGEENTIIKGSGETSVVTIANGETSDLEMTGFTIMGGGGTVEVTTVEESVDSYTTYTTTTYMYYGGGVYVNGASPTLHDLTITDNDAPAYSYSNPSSTEAVYVYSYGGGLFAADATLDSYSLSFVDNYADNGGGAYLNGATTLDAKWFLFDGNWASAGGGASVAGTAGFTNSIFVDNGSSSDGSMVGGAGVDVQGGDVSLEFVSTASNEGLASAYLTSGGSLTLLNSILFDNDSGYLIDGDLGTSLSASYSDVYGGYSGDYGVVYTDPTGSSGMISEDPEFTSWIDDGDYSDDLSLAAGSPAAGSGSGGVDMGAYGGPDGTW